MLAATPKKFPFKQEHQASSSGTRTTRNHRGDDEESVELRLRVNFRKYQHFGDDEINDFDDDDYSDDDDGDDEGDSKRWWTKLVNFLQGSLETGVQIFIDFCRRLRSQLRTQHNKHWESPHWKDTIKREASEAKKRSAENIDNIADKYIEMVETLDEPQRGPAAGLFADSIDILRKFGRKVVEKIFMIIGYIHDFLGKAWSMLGGVVMSIKEAAKEAVEIIRRIFSSGSRGGGESGIPLLQRVQ